MSTLFMLTLSNACERHCHHGRTWSTETVTFSFVETSYVETNIAKPATISPINKDLNGITLTEAKSLVRKAASIWSSCSNLKLIEVKDCKSVQIRIGATNLNAYQAGFGYFPGTKGVNGDIHLDNSERTWSKALFYKVILHEMGHTLGLVHNKNSDSIMYYKITDKDQLDSLDIAHIQNLYGSSKSSSVAQFTAKVTSSHSSQGEVVKVQLLSRNNETIHLPKRRSFGSAILAFFN